MSKFAITYKFLSQYEANTYGGKILNWNQHRIVVVEGIDEETAKVDLVHRASFLGYTIGIVKVRKIIQIA